MAPEVMERQDHSLAVDYYAVGVIAFECMLGKRPYMGKNKKEIH
jgi:serine/threonine protein kinase